MNKKISRKRVAEFLNRYKNGAVVTIFYGNIVNTFQSSEGFTFKIRGSDLLVFDPDGNFFDRYDLVCTKIYVKD